MPALSIEEAPERALIVKNSGGLKGNSHGGEVTPSTECTARKVHELSERKATEAVKENSVVEMKDSQEIEDLGKVIGEEDRTTSITQEADDENRKVVVIVDDQEEDEDEEESEDAVGLLSAEELNKKCEDFIRKMREGIKFEAQQVVMALC